MDEMLSYVFSKQRISKEDRFSTVAKAVSDRGYVRGDQELMLRVKEKTSMKRQAEKDVVVKMTLSPPYQGYTSQKHAWLFRAEKGYVPDEAARDLISIIKDRQPVSKKEIVDHSPYSLDRTVELLSELSKASVLCQDGESQYRLVQLRDVDRMDASKEVAKMHFGYFGVFSAEELSYFLSVRMPQVRKVLRTLEDEGFLKKGFFLEGDSTLRWMLAEDVGKEPPKFKENFLLNTQDNLHIYLRGLLKEQVPSARSVIFSGTRVVGSFKGKVCPTGAKVEEFEGSDRARRIMKEAAQSVGVSLETERQREDDDWDVSEFYIKVNPGA
jgi:ATP-dependent Lhr-like helicase